MLCKAPKILADPSKGLTNGIMGDVKVGNGAHYTLMYGDNNILVSVGHAGDTNRFIENVEAKLRMQGKQMSPIGNKRW
jgi:hypothetical protein